MRQVPEGSGEQEKWRKLVQNHLCAPTTFAVKGLMMMMKMIQMLTRSHTDCDFDMLYRKEIIDMFLDS